MKRKLLDIALVTLGSVVMSVGFNTMFVDNHIASGGMIGLSVSFQQLFGWAPSNFLMATNIPLLILCWLFLGKENFFKTLYGSWIYPLCIKWTASLPSLTENPLLAAIFGGIIVGAGLGIVFWGNSSTGGTGILTQILHKYTPLSLAISMTIVDGFSVAMGFVAFDVDTVMHSIIALIVISYVVNVMETGFNGSRNLMIISKENEAIRQYITTVANRGVTTMPIIGGYTTEAKTMLMTTVTNYELTKLEQAILEIDKVAFMVVMPATRVRGRGFSLTKYYTVEASDLLPPG